MSSKKKSLAQTLADLFNPAPTRETDPDALDLGDVAKLASDDEYGEARQAPSKRAPEKTMLLRGDIAIEDAVYRGRKTSRAAVFGEEDGVAGDSDDGIEMVGKDDDDDDGDKQNLSDEGDDEDGDGGAERRQAGTRAGTSGRGGAATAAAAGKGAKGGVALKHDGAAVANGGPHASDGEDEEDEDEDDDEGIAGGELLSGSGSDLDMEDGRGDSGGGEDEDGGGGEDEVVEEEEGRGLRRSGAADGPSRQTGRAGRAGGGSNELDALEAEYEALQEEDERQLAALRKKGERDREKGAAVRNQQMLYERALEQRILLQKCLQASNGLPRPDTHTVLVAAHSGVREGYAQLAAAARNTLHQLLGLQHELMARISGIALPPPPAAAAAGRAAQGAAAKRRRPDADDSVEAAADSSLDATWQRLSSHYEALAPFRDLSLDSWHRRTVLSSGSGALRNSGLRALNQSISSQVQALMRDPGKFIKRTRLVLSACPRVLCEPPRAGAASAALDLLGSDADAVGPGQSYRGDGAAAATAVAGPASSVAADVADEERDPETYDDSEFYQQLLKEFLDKGLAQGAVAAPKSAKKRKLVDRRASKGRKLRYHVQEKLVAFMAPVDFTPPPFAANLFSNLFGHAGK